MRDSCLDQFSAAELQAMRLDGELMRFGPDALGRYLPVDEPQSVAVRAATLADVIPDGLVAASMTAAWLYDGLCPGHRPIVIARRRRKPPTGRWELDVRYARITEAEFVTIDGVAVTTLVRTFRDLALEPECSEPRLRALWVSLTPETRLMLREQVATLRGRRLHAQARDRLARAMAEHVEPRPATM